MTLADVNVLLYAFREDSLRHGECKAWLDETISKSDRFGVSKLALGAVVRITTSARYFPHPSSLHDAFGFCDDLLEQPNCVNLQPGERHWSIFRQICLDANVRGPTTTDAWYAALAIEHSCTWITFDRDFARFPGLDWREPAL